MMIPTAISEAISEARQLLGDIMLKIQSDPLLYDEIQIDRQEFYYFQFNKLKQFNFEKILIELQNHNLNRNILYGITTIIEKYNHFYEKERSKFNSFDYSALYEFYLQINYDTNIVTLKSDIEDVEDLNNPLPSWEKENLLSEFRNEIKKLQQAKTGHINSYGWFFINYYEKFYNGFKLLINQINLYFPENELEIDSDLFSRNFINELYNICEENTIFKKENISFENFYLILNQRIPKKNCINLIDRKTAFAYPLKHLWQNIKDKHLKDNWLEFICSNFGLNPNTINSHGNNKDKSTEVFYDLFGAKNSN